MGVDVGASFKIGADPSRRNGENPVPARFSEWEALAGRHQKMVFTWCQQVEKPATVLVVLLDLVIMMKYIK